MYLVNDSSLGQLLTSRMNIVPREIPGIPTYTGRAAYKELFSRWGVPNSCPRLGERHFGRSRVLFVDDDNDGEPQAYWIPGGSATR